MSLLDTGESLSPELLDSCGWKQISQDVREKYRFIPQEMGGANFEGSIYIHRYKTMLSKNITKTHSHIEWRVCDVLIGYKTCFVLSADDMHPKLISVWFVWVPQYKLVQYVEDLNDINEISFTNDSDEPAVKVEICADINTYIQNILRKHNYESA